MAQKLNEIASTNEMASLDEIALKCLWDESKKQDLDVGKVSPFEPINRRFFEFEIMDLKGDLQTCERLYEMGLHKGLKVNLVGRAPFMGPWLIQFGSTTIALRDNEAKCLTVQKFLKK